MVSFSEEKVTVTYGFDPNRFGGDEEVAIAEKPRASLAAITQRTVVPFSDRNFGLGKKLGGQLTRSAFGGAAYEMLDPSSRARQARYEISVNTLRQRKVTRLPPNAAARFSQAENSSLKTKVTTSLSDCDSIGIFNELVLSDQNWARTETCQDDIHAISLHRWTFTGALELAKKGRSFCFFVRCLLDLQRNVQLEEAGNPLDAELVKACALFVSGQCNAGRAGDMYQILTHFMGNALVFEEWDKYLKGAFESSRASEESFLVPHLEQVWGRFCRLANTLEGIFDTLNRRFVDQHRLPDIGDLLREHMKRRCFTSESVIRNAMFMQEKCTNETVKEIKHAFKFG
mmetsp:Transcript_92873/g.161382  ORF Transcript_92873/g.161382 Transcript_92873/m.161382 type:complete len:343 (-) Transcript_92873:55-1083(-)